MVLVIAGLTGVALLLVRQTVQEHAQQELTTSAHNSLGMFQILQHQRQAMMSRKADFKLPRPFSPTTCAGVQQTPGDSTQSAGSKCSGDGKCIFIAGYLEQMEQSPKFMDTSLFLEKPFTREILLHKVNEAFRSADLALLER
jgi:hypothetical protein